MTVSNQSCDQVDQEIDRATVAQMLKLADVFELIINGLNNRPFAQEQFVRYLKQAIVLLAS